MHNSCDLCTQLKSRDRHMYDPPVNAVSGIDTGNRRASWMVY